MKRDSVGEILNYCLSDWLSKGSPARRRRVGELSRSARRAALSESLRGAVRSYEFAGSLSKFVTSYRITLPTRLTAAHLPYIAGEAWALPCQCDKLQFMDFFDKLNWPTVGRLWAIIFCFCKIRQLSHGNAYIISWDRGLSHLSGPPNSQGSPCNIGPV